MIDMDLDFFNIDKQICLLSKRLYVGTLSYRDFKLKYEDRLSNH
jgi:hypothetical protein